MPKSARDPGLEWDPFWYKKGVVYQAHVRSFYDADGNGIGDFRGLTEKLGYLKDLGVTALWLLPFYPSPLKDDGYDIADYRTINPAYGTLADFRQFLQEAHQLGLRVITELVVNHTSDQHRWFQRSRRAKPGSTWREMYVWSLTPDKYKDARIIFEDFETSNWTWDSMANAYYWHRFYSHQPDLNFENPLVHRQILKLLDFEGEPARALSERRIKKSPLRDAAGMIRSFHYATHAALYQQVEHGNLDRQDLARLEPWAQFWSSWVSVTFLKSYLEVAGNDRFLPKSREEREILLNAYCLEKAIYELGYELNNRPDWVRIPLQGILQLIEK